MLGITTTNVYVVPTGTTSTVLGIAIANTSGVSVLVGVGITRTTQDDVRFVKECSHSTGIYARICRR